MKTMEKREKQLIEQGWSYDRTDRNGTKYYFTYKCERCGGTGYINYFSHVDKGVCFKCGGSGTQETKRVEKIMTPEHFAKLEAKRIAKAQAKAIEENKTFLERKGFNEDGKTYAVLGNTYSIKEELKALGAKYDGILGWHMPQDSDKYDTVEITVDEIYRKDYNGVYNQNLTADEASTKIKKATAALTKAESKSQHIGTVGDKVEMNLRLSKISGFDGMYGYTFIYRFYDNNENVIIWKTSKAPADFEKGLQEGNYYSVTGTIKAHSEYKSEPQTVITRCKIK